MQLKIPLLILLSGLTTGIFSAVTPLRAVHRLSIYGSNCFILETDSSLIMIDAGYPGGEKKILSTISKLARPLRLIVLTHGHFDHYGSADAVHKVTGAPVAVFYLDAEYVCNGTTPLDSVRGYGRLGKRILPLAERVFKPAAVCPDIELHDGDSLDRFGLRADIIHTPGHTNGSISILVQDSIVFVGDLLTVTLFVDKQRFFAQSWSAIDESVKKLLHYRFEKVYIGHTGRIANRKTLRKLVGKK